MHISYGLYGNVKNKVLLIFLSGFERKVQVLLLYPNCATRAFAIFYFLSATSAETSLLIVFFFLINKFSTDSFLAESRSLNK